MLPTAILGKCISIRTFVEDYRKLQNTTKNSSGSQWKNDSVLCLQWNTLQLLKIIRDSYVLMWKDLQDILTSEKMETVLCIVISNFLNIYTYFLWTYSQIIWLLVGVNQGILGRDTENSFAFYFAHFVLFEHFTMH